MKTKIKPIIDLPPAESFTPEQKNAIKLSNVPMSKSLKKQNLLESKLNEVTSKARKCYYCDFNKFQSVDDYTKHVLITHSGKLCFPGRVGIIKLGLTSSAAHGRFEIINCLSPRVILKLKLKLKLK